MCQHRSSTSSVIEANMLRLLLFISAVSVLFALSASITPVVLYHGLGDTANGSLGPTRTLIQQQIPHIYVLSIQIGNTADEDEYYSYFMNLNKQVELACATISSDANLKDGYNAIGFSQGGQITRAIAQRCPQPPVRNLISIGGQQQGVYGLPKCLAANQTLCEEVRILLDGPIYTPPIQEILAPANYWHDPWQLPLYELGSIFLADINNERVVKNSSYKDNLVKLDNFVMVQFTQETTVQPKESEWFEFYAPGQDKTILSLKDSQIYKEDWIGLKELDEAGKLHFLKVEADHMQYNNSWFQANILEPYLRN